MEQSSRKYLKLGMNARGVNQEGDKRNSDSLRGTLLKRCQYRKEQLLRPIAKKLLKRGGERTGRGGAARLSKGKQQDQREDV